MLEQHTGVNTAEYYRELTAEFSGSFHVNSDKVAAGLTQI